MKRPALQRLVRATGALTLLAAAVVARAAAPEEAKPHHPAHGEATAAQVRIPQAMRIEHEEIHGALVRATKVQGPVGAAARELAQVLHPHFVREEEIALPPLGLLRPLSRGETVPGAREALAMTEALRAELPRMLHEHEAIGAAAKRLESVARAHKNKAVEELARKLQLHAQSEEEVFYPAALLVGDLLRTRSS